MIRGPDHPCERDDLKRELMDKARDAGRLKRDLFTVDFRRARELQPAEKPEPIHRIAYVDSRQWR